MKDIFMFCEDGECVCENLCCQECQKNGSCEKRCDSIRFKEAVYRGEKDDELIQDLEEVAEQSSRWLAVVAVERFKEVKESRSELLGAAKEVCGWLSEKHVNLIKKHDMELEGYLNIIRKLKNVITKAEGKEAEDE